MSEKSYCCECGADIANKPSGWHYKQKNEGETCSACLDLLITTDEDVPMSCSPIKARQILQEIKDNAIGADKIALDYMEAVFNGEKPNKEDSLNQCDDNDRPELKKLLCDIDQMYQNKLKDLPLLTGIDDDSDKR